MKKKTRSRSSNNLSVVFWSTVLLCLFGTYYYSSLFYNDIRRTQNSEAEVIATITFKYKTAERKLLARNVWDRLSQDSVVYNGDTIHTANLAEATVWFLDGNVLELSQNSIAQVFMNEDKSVGANLEKGEAVLDASESESGMTLSSSGVTVSVGSGSSVSAASSTANQTNGSDVQTVSLQVIKGNATVTEGEKETQVAEGESVSMEGEEVLVPELIVLSPTPNQRILTHETDGGRIHFNWNANIDEKTSIILEIAQDKDFMEIIRFVTVTNINEIDFLLPARNYYWRLRTVHKTEEGEQLSGEVASGKTQILQSLPPQLVTPVQNYSYSYRTKLPAVRLIWSESEYANSYRLEISDKPDFSTNIIQQRTTSTSSIISTLKQGTYWWRVTPYYTLNRIGYEAPSVTNTFTIEQKGELLAPEILLPSPNGIVNTEINAKDTFFSWKMDPEADYYKIIIANNQNLKNPLVSENVNSNFYSLNPSRASMRDGQWYWSVQSVDNEGNTSALAETRSLYAMKGKPEQHTIEPMEGYKIAQTLVPDTRFTWKRNLPEGFTTSIQIARDSGFRNIVYSNAVTGTNLKGISLAEGNYWWRLVSANAENGGVLETEGKQFSVVGNLDAAVLNLPFDKTIAQENKPNEFTWEPVDGADYYKLEVFKKSDNTLVHQETVWENSTYIDLYTSDYEDKSNYRYQVQAFANEIPGVSSRRTGKIAEKEFYLVKLRPVEVTSPSRGQALDGLKAVLEPYKARWRTFDTLEEAQFVLYKVDGKKSEVMMKIPTDDQIAHGKKLAPFSVTMDTADGLHAGNYEIIIYAKTRDKIDVTNSEERYKGKFTINPIPPLNSVDGLVTTPEHFDNKYVQKTKSPIIQMKWKKVEDATSYVFKLMKADNLDNPIVNVELTDTSYQIDIAAIFNEDKELYELLHQGNFVWSVNALRRIDTDKDGELDKVLQESAKPSSAKLKTDYLTLNKNASQKGVKNAYAK